jgi:acyl carrier protein
MNSIKSQIRRFIIDNFHLEKDSVLKDDDSLLGNGFVDSTGILEVVSFIENNFGFKVEDHEFLPENLDTIDNLSTYILGKNSWVHNCENASAPSM